MVTSDHIPIDVDNKKTDIDSAKNGTVGLESFFGALLTIFSLDESIRILTSGKQRFGINNHPIQEGSNADLTLFTNNDNYTFSKSNILSKSKNSAFLGMKMSGTSLGVIVGEKYIINE